MVPKTCGTASWHCAVDSTSPPHRALSTGYTRNLLPLGADVDMRLRRDEEEGDKVCVR